MFGRWLFSLCTATEINGFSCATVLSVCVCWLNWRQPGLEDSPPMWLMAVQTNRVWPSFHFIFPSSHPLMCPLNLLCLLQLNLHFIFFFTPQHHQPFSTMCFPLWSVIFSFSIVCVRVCPHIFLQKLNLSIEARFPRLTLVGSQQERGNAFLPLFFWTQNVSSNSLVTRSLRNTFLTPACLLFFMFKYILHFRWGQMVFSL